MDCAAALSAVTGLKNATTVASTRIVVCYFISFALFSFPCGCLSNVGLVVDAEDEGISGKRREAKTSALAAVSQNAPAGAVGHNAHVVSLPPPARHFTRPRDPHLALVADERQVR